MMTVMATVMVMMMVRALDNDRSDKKKVIP